MKTKHRIIQWLALLALVTLNSQLSTAVAQGTTAFTYQGQLRDGGTNANGAYTMIFKLYDAVTSGNQIGSTITTSATLANGLFSVNLDFGAVPFNGSARWLDITVSNGVAQTLSPRVQVLTAPYAQFAAVAATVTNGAIMNAQLAGNAVATTNIQNYAITTTQITNGAVTDAKIISVSGAKVTGSVASATNFTGNLAGDVTGPQGATVINNVSGNVSFSGNPKFTGNPLFTSNIRLQQGAAGTTLWNVSVGNAAGPASYSLDNALIFSANGVPCLAVADMPGDGPLVFAPNGLGALEVDCGEMNVRDSSWNTVVVSIDSGGTIRATGDISCDKINTSGTIYAGGDVCGHTLCGNSDRNLKEEFAPVDAAQVLELVTRLPISTWNFKTDPAIRHVGPMAQDFYAAFNVGADDKHIATVDEGGVALAAIQGLNEKLNEKDAKIEAMEKRLADLEELIKTSAQK
jgi:hypothetical protein